MGSALNTVIRLSRNQIRSNPILQSERAFCCASHRREQEKRQLESLIELHESGVQIFHCPTFIRVDGSVLTLSSERIGVVGLVVDGQGIGYVSRLKATQNFRWDIQTCLPFREEHIQSLLLKIVGESHSQTALPELFAFQISASLEERSEGDSMDIAGLLSVVDSANMHASELLASVVAVVSPAIEDKLEKSKSVTAKLAAFVREFKHGSLLVRLSGDRDAESFDENFDRVWEVQTLTDLADRLRESGLLAPMLASFPLAAKHANLIADRVEKLLADENRYVETEDFLRRLKIRFTEITPLRVKLDVLYAEEDLYRHRGSFGHALEVRAQRTHLEENPAITCYERRISSDNRLAASLYDAHSFADIFKLLEPWAEKIEQDPQICLPETRSFLFNTLARSFVVVGDQRWETYLHASLKIQKETNPENVPRTLNVLVHCLLKAGRLIDAHLEINRLKIGQDGNGSDNSDPFLLWLRAEYSRKTGETWDYPLVRNDEKLVRDHAWGFVYQAIARQANQTRERRCALLEQARRVFVHGTTDDKANIKRLFAGCCKLSIAVLTGDHHSGKDAFEEIECLLEHPSLVDARHWYASELDEIRTNLSEESVDRMFERIPHF